MKKKLQFLRIPFLYYCIYYLLYYVSIHIYLCVNLFIYAPYSALSQYERVDIWKYTLYGPNFFPH